MRPAVLTIAGSDSGGGAGIQADLKAIEAMGAHGASAITAITAQNSRAVTDVFTLPDTIVEAQIDAVMGEIQPAVVKVGMLGNARLVSLVARKLRQWRPSLTVLDPVMIASSGARLLERDAIGAMRQELVPLSVLITPNWDEAAELTGIKPHGLEDVAALVSALRRLGAQSVLLKGGHLRGPDVVDTLFHQGRLTQFTHERIPRAEGHGTGCALASSIAARLALGDDMIEACTRATAYVHDALLSRYATGGSKDVYLALGSPKPGGG